MVEKKQENLIIEVKNVEEANKIDAKQYRFERYSETRDVYIFVKRSKPLE